MLKTFCEYNNKTMENPKKHITLLKQIYESPEGGISTTALAEMLNWKSYNVYHLGDLLISRSLAKKEIRLIPKENFHNGKMKVTFWRINDKKIDLIIKLIRENYPDD